VGTLPHFNPDLDGEGSTPPAAVLDLRERVAAASGLIISTPEYAHGLPGSMKNALDWLVSSPAPIGKPVVLWNAAPYGGEYAQASLVETLQVMGLLLLLDASRVEPFLSRKLDGEGLLPDPESEAVLRASLAMLAAVIGDR
jgi:Predicted flavoprotein